jgi:hypothetical protein
MQALISGAFVMHNTAFDHLDNHTSAVCVDCFVLARWARGPGRPQPGIHGGSVRV